MAANNNRTILVTGATGHQGGAAFHRLRQRGFALRALVRNPEKPEARELEGSRVEVLRGDFDDPESIKRALDGADGAYSVQAWQAGPEVESRQGIAFAEAGAFKHPLSLHVLLDQAAVVNERIIRERSSESS